jgi:diaminopimelate decarboxylase
MAEFGLGVDVVTLGHIRLALAGGTYPEKIIFNGNAKTLEELNWAVRHQVRCVNVDSLTEFQRLLDVSSSQATPVRICLRLATETDRHIGDDELLAWEPGKFGMTRSEALQAASAASRHPLLQVVGLHHHFGFTGAPAAQTVRRHRTFVRQIVEVAREVEVITDQPLEILNIGGGFRKGRGTGFGPRRLQSFPTLAEYADCTAGELARLLDEKPLLGTPRLVVEAGGYLVADATLLLAAVGFEKACPDGATKRWVFLENTSAYHFVRRLMFDFYHEIVVASPARAGQLAAATVCGPICTDDDIARGVMLPPLASGDIIAILDQGAYCEAITSDYCAVPIPSAVMLKNGHATVTRLRQTADDLVSTFSQIRGSPASPRVQA